MSKIKLDEENNQNRFEFVSKQSFLSTDYVVLVDKATGVNYLSASYGMDGGTRVIPMLDKDGKPYVDPRFGSR